MADTPTRLDNLHAALLEPIVTASVEAPNPVKVTAWTWEAVTGGLGGQGVYRVSGRALADAVATEWSVIVKVLRSGESNTEPSSESFWLREREVIRSGLLEGVEDGVSAPRCLAVEDIAPDETWLWFEELHNDIPHPWPTETWAEVARPLRFLNLGFGLWLVIAPWLLGGGTVPGSLVGILAGLALIILSLPRGRRSAEHYGSWDRYVV